MKTLKLIEKEKNKPSFLLLSVFWLLILAFLFVLSEFLVPLVREIFKGSLLFLLPLVIFSLLGLWLTYLSLREKTLGLIRKFLILTGVSAGAFFISIFLHNMFYALAEISSKISWLSSLAEILHAGFFLISIFACPIGFLVGALGTIIMLIKKRNN